ncbi:MAG: TraB/GumN family protein [Pseudohongiellaceae bacterium]
MIKAILVLLTLLAGLVPVVTVAQTSTFNNGTGLLHIGCVARYDDGPIVKDDGSLDAYSVNIQKNFFHYFVIDVTPLEGRQDCSGQFEVATATFTDIVRMRDGAFSISLIPRGDGSFRLQHFLYVGPADTSLWRVSNGDAEVVIGGSLHMLDQRAFPLPMGFEEAYLNTNELVLDIDNLSTQYPPNVNQYLNAARRTDGVSLQSILAPGVYASLESHLQPLGLPIAFIDDWKPAFVVDLLTSLRLRNTGFSVPSVDIYYGLRAFADEKPITVIATYSEQYQKLEELYDGIDPNDLIHTRLNQLENYKLGSRLNTNIKAWQLGAENHLYHADILPIDEVDDSHYRSLVAQQNAQWLPLIIAMFETPEVELVLVRVSHLTGENGLLQSLRDLGYSVEYY